MSHSAALLDPSPRLPRLQAVAPPPPKQGFLLPPADERVHPQSGVLGSSAAGGVRVEAHGATQVRNLPVRPGDDGLGAGGSGAQVPGGAADVLPAGEHGGEADRDGRVGPVDVGAGEGRVRVRVHDSEVESVRRYAFDAVVFRDGGGGGGGEAAGGGGPRREQERPEFGVGVRREEGGVVGGEGDERGEGRVRGGGGGGGDLGGERVRDGDAGGFQEQRRGVRHGGERGVEAGGGGLAGEAVPEVVRREEWEFAHLLGGGGRGGAGGGVRGRPRRGADPRRGGGLPGGAACLLSQGGRAEW